MKKTHLSLDDRITISRMLSEQCSFKQIALAVGKNCTSISREVRNHIVFKKTGGYGRSYNACRHRFGCPHSSLCPSCTSPKKKLCSFCEKCNSNCPDFVQEFCPLLDKPPYVCNGWMPLFHHSSSADSLSIIFAPITRIALWSVKALFTA